MREIELLAPAKDLKCGMAAISHGADAVYIGAPTFGARAAACNSVDDIRQLCLYAHQFRARVYVTVNTIIYEDELAELRLLLRQLSDAGVDAILVQDMAIVAMVREMGDLGFRIHASTQTDNRDASKVTWLHDVGFSRVVLARELSIDEIRDIHHSVPGAELEAFVHGALCVSYSGQCYASQCAFHRSANRGECAQFCRLPFSLVDGNGSVMSRGHLLSLRDMCRIDYLEELLDAGVTSLKIEGRLKDVGYVKNVVAAYSQRLNEIVSRRKGDYRRASYGRVEYTFQPDVHRSFNRGFTDYFLHGRTNDIYNFTTPKATGVYVGKVKTIGRGFIVVSGCSAFANGDGLCFVYADDRLVGFRVNRAEGNHLFPHRMPAGLKPGMRLYRNNDAAFEKMMSAETALRRIDVEIEVNLTDDGIRVEMRSLDGMTKVSRDLSMDIVPAEHNQHDNIVRQLSRLGNTNYRCERIILGRGVDEVFIPSSLLAETRRAIVGMMGTKIEMGVKMEAGEDNNIPYEASLSVPAVSHPYLLNVSNSIARRFYEEHGVMNVGEALEAMDRKSVAAQGEVMVMQCRHCLRYAHGMCPKYGGKPSGHPEPWYLVSDDGSRYRLRFDCKRCVMNILR